METARLHWEILQRVPDELANKVRAFMVIGEDGEGVLLSTEDGEGYWMGEMKFGKKSKQAMEPTRLNVPKLASMAHGDGHILLLDEDGQIHAMGEKNHGQLGLGTDDQKISFSPQLISIPHKFTTVRCGDAHSLALTEDGKVWAWGLNNSGQVGVPTSTANHCPSLRQISELDAHRVVSIDCGGWHSLALTDQGEVYSWGANDCGQLGERRKYYEHIPTLMPTSSPIKSVAAGDSHTLLLTQNGEVYACGGNQYGQLALRTGTKFKYCLVKVDSLPVISQILSHFNSNLSIAMSNERECFAWGCLGSNNLDNEPFSFIPVKFPPIYSTLESVLSFQSSPRNTPYSVRVEGLGFPQRNVSETQTESQFESNPVANQIQGEECHKIDSTTPTELQSGSIRLGDRVCRMFDNPESNPDVKFEFEDLSILAHRSVLQISSAYFNRFFSEFSSSANFNQPSSNSYSNPLLDTSTTNPSEPDSQDSPISPLTTIPIPDHCYPTFHAYLHFLYTGTLQVPTEHLVDLFELAHSHLESDLSELCLVRMRSTLSPENCCLFYQLTERHSLPEFQQDLLQFISNNILQVFPTTAYQSMDGDLCRKLAISIANLQR